MGNFVTGNTALPAQKTDAYPPTGLATELDAADINSLWSAAGDLRTAANATAPVVNVKDPQWAGGARGDGLTDDTAAIQAAINGGYGKRLQVPAGTYLVTGLTATSSIQMFGEGTLKMANSTVADLLAISGISTVVQISGLGFDGNETSQAVDTTNRTINFAAVGTASVPAGLSITRCSFTNGPYSDIRVSTDGLATTVEWVRIVGNIFLGGREGETQAYDPRYIDLASAVEYVVDSNLFDRLAAPTTFGRAGVVAHDGTGTGAEGRGSISGNTFVNVGRSQLNSSLAAIDLYSRQNGVSVSGNSIVNPYGRAIDVKADSRDITITGNAVSGLAGGSDGTMSAQIVLNQGTINAVANGPFTISGNSLFNSGNDGISIDARDLGGTLYAKGISVTGNTITNATRRGIGIAAAAEVSITNNNVVGGSPSIFVDATTTTIHITGNHLTPVTNGVQVSNANTTAFLDIATNTSSGGLRCVIVQSGAGGSISGNVAKAPSTSAVDISGTTGPLRVANNVSDAATPFVNSGTNTALHVQHNDWTMGTTAHTLTIATGVVTASMDWHYVETTGGGPSDTLTTVNGGYDGQVLTLRPATTGHVVIVQDSTGNLRLNGDFALDNQQDSITLRWANDAWIEMSRSDNLTVQNTASISAGGQTASPSLKAGTEFITISVIGAFAYTVGAPLGATSARFLTVRVKNTSAGAIGPGTWNAIYKMSAWTEPLAGQSRTITFLFDGTNWVELSRTPADVVN